MSAVPAIAAPIDELGQGDLTTTIAERLRDHFGDDRHAVRKLAEAANTNERTAENWLLGKNAPGVLHFLKLMAAIPSLQAEVRRLCAMEADLDPELARDMQALITTFQRRQATR